MKTNLRTSYRNSPVISIKRDNRAELKLAIDENGNIYRYVNNNEQLVNVEEFEVLLSEQSQQLIAEYLKCYKYSRTIKGKLFIKIEIQKMLQSGCGYISYSLQAEPLYTLDTNRYFDVCELSNKMQIIKRQEKTISNFRNYGTDNDKAIKKIIAEREKTEAKNKKIADKKKAEAIIAEAKNLLAKRKEGYLYVAIVRQWAGNPGHLKFEGKIKEFRKDKPKTKVYFELNCKNLKQALELAKITFDY